MAVPTMQVSLHHPNKNAPANLACRMSIEYNGLVLQIQVSDDKEGLAVFCHTSSGLAEPACIVPQATNSFKVCTRVPRIPKA